MSIWLKHTLLAIILIVLAGIAIVFYNDKISMPTPEGAKMRKNPAKGLSEFYTEYRLSAVDPIQEELGDFVIGLNPANESVDDRLRDMENSGKSPANGWVGEHKFRSFKPGKTLREAITEFAQNEGMQVFWELDQDFIVKNHFQMDDTITGSLHTLAKAIDSNFDGEVMTFFCPKHRTLVITTESNNYLDKNCVRSNPY
jgi:hypothetical protein